MQTVDGKGALDGSVPTDLLELALENLRWLDGSP
jgi:hypothetical protein